jgi:hypothetical protein
LYSSHRRVNSPPFRIQDGKAITRDHPGGGRAARGRNHEQSRLLHITLPEHLRLPASRAGAMSCLTGIAARKSMDAEKPVRIADLVRI